MGKVVAVHWPAGRGQQTKVTVLFCSCRGCEELVSLWVCVSVCVTCGSSSKTAMQTVGPSGSSGNVWSVGPISGTQRQREPSGTQGRTEASGQEAEKTLFTSTYSLLIYSILAPPAVKVIRVEHLPKWRSPSAVKVNRVEQHQPSACPGLKGSSTLDFLLVVHTPP